MLVNIRRAIVVVATRVVGTAVGGAIDVLGIGETSIKIAKQA